MQWTFATQMACTRVLSAVAWLHAALLCCESPAHNHRPDTPVLNTLCACGGIPGGRRSRSRVSFHIAAKVSFLESSDGGAATGPSSTPEKESSNPTGASVGSQGGSSDAGGSRAGGSAAGGSAAGGYISTAAGQLCHMQVMRGSIVGVPLPQQSPEAIAGQALGKGDSSRSERGPSTSGDTTQGGEMRSEQACGRP